ncbi:N-acetylglucosamine-6-phosphate deacetylase [Sphingomonas profundi]|uniref:N-acetylglucosamine-6-phosphate deacetylase n=1 Tax=Alterirhizorhabdus profundi TaxID=2681549 RepID=UPI0012E74778|nr:N-acetylglucosamine-6-phosphate deacetylase [Sphingomonas profundi]
MRAPTVKAFVNGRVLLDGVLREDRIVLVEGDRIAAVATGDAVPADAERIDLAGDVLAPGFIDTQVNGGGGVLFNDAPTVETIARIGAAHRRFGTTGFLPTVISDDPAVVDRAVAAVAQAIAQGVPGVLGIHIEGPFLNVARKGIHRADKIRPLDESGIAELTRPTGGVTMATLAPERTTPATIARLADAGVVVMAGHSDATYAEASAAIAAGMAGATHLFNAMSQLGNREPGMVGAILDHDGLVSGIIVDGRHVSPATLRVALRARPTADFMLVTDAMPSVGGPKAFDLQGRAIRVEDGVCVDDRGVLAGSDLDMAAAVRNAIALLGLGEAEALTMAAASAARLLRLDHRLGRIAPGSQADLVRLREGRVTDTWIGGIGHAA